VSMGMRLVTWRQLLDSGLMQEGEPHLAATARPTVAVLSATTAAQFGGMVTVSGPSGSVTVPVAVGDILDDTVWLPLNSPGCHVYAELGVHEGDQVALIRGGGA
ncbi:MAG: NADH-quinone oxidoreductase subunit G, partial [bacterium]|nr:NADH-quinone oxidoreductase subunit G [bacterium]